MGILLSSEEIRAQSRQVWGQFGESLWIPNAKKNALLKSRDLNELQHSGVGKTAVLCAMGASLEDNVETIKKHRDKVDVICCDKAFGPLYDHGIKADYVVVADAGIPFRYIKDHIQYTDGVKLLATPYANTEWTHAWKGPLYFYVNMDAIESERVFSAIIGKDTRIIPASSNVSNAMVVLWTNCEKKKNENWGGYEEYYLVGYDYSWLAKGNYYAWNNPTPKRYYMNHRTLIDMAKNMVFTSENLLFSCKWLISYISTFDLPVVNCSMRGLLDIQKKARLDIALGELAGNEKHQALIKDAFHSWKSAFENYKRSENSFFSLKEALLWQ